MPFRLLIRSYTATAICPPSRGSNGIKLNKPTKTLIVARKRSRPGHPVSVSCAPILVAPTTETTLPSSLLEELKTSSSESVESTSKTSEKKLPKPLGLKKLPSPTIVSFARNPNSFPVSITAFAGFTFSFEKSLLAIPKKPLPSVWPIEPASRCPNSVSYTHLRAHETVLDLVCRLLLEKKN